jgi:hypothetical protein
MCPVWVAEDVADVGVGPAADRPVGVDRGGRGVGGEVEVEPLGDHLVTQAFLEPPGEDSLHDGGVAGVGFEEGLFPSLGPFGRDRMRDTFGPVTVAGLADVETFLGVHGEPVPGLLQHLHHIELGDALLDPAGEQLRGDFGFAARGLGELEGLVRGQQPHPGAFETVLDIGGDVGTPRDAVDGLADHVVEPVGFK